MPFEIIKDNGKLPPRDNTHSNNATPSERVAKFIIKLLSDLKSFFEFIVYSSGSKPQGKVIRHQGEPLPPGQTIRFPKIMVVEDNINIASDMAHAIQRHYSHGNVDIYLAYGISTAQAYFEQENIDLIIMDNDLNEEEGDGVQLTGKFKTARPEVVILANSSSTISNNKLLSCGAETSVNKSWKQLAEWLKVNDRIGSPQADQIR